MNLFCGGSEKLPYVRKSPAGAFFSDKLTFLDFWDMLNLRKLHFCSYLVIFPPYWCRLGPYKAYVHVYYAYAYAYVYVYAHVSFLGPFKNKQKTKKLLGAHQEHAPMTKNFETHILADFFIKLPFYKNNVGQFLF